MFVSVRRKTNGDTMRNSSTFASEGSMHFEDSLIGTS